MAWQLDIGWKLNPKKKLQLAYFSRRLHSPRPPKIRSHAEKQFPSKAQFKTMLVRFLLMSCLVSSRFAKRWKKRCSFVQRTEKHLKSIQLTFPGQKIGRASCRERV